MDDLENFNDDIKVKNEALILNSNMIDINKLVKTVCKIKITNIGYLGTGFFIKLIRENNPFYCLISCEHVLKEDFIKEKYEIQIYYEQENKKLKIILDEGKRYIKYFKYVDTSVVEILREDGLSEDNFLFPNLDLDDYDYEKLKSKNIFIPQYPLGQNLKLSTGEFKEIISHIYAFYHFSSTNEGSSGSPVFLSENGKIFGIHKGSIEKEKKNLFYCLFPVLRAIKLDLKYKEEIYQKDNNTVIYCGEYKNDSKEGYGIIQIYDNSDKVMIYDGEWKNNKKHGKGIIFCQNNNIKKIIFKGDFKNGKKEGKGLYIFENGEYYIGEWSNDMKEGKGKLFYKNKTIKFEGEFEKDKYKQGKLIYKDGEYYEGSFYDGLCSGKGKIYYPNGSLKHDGNFADDDCEGEGTHIYECGDIFIGVYEKGERKNGKVYSKDKKLIYNGSFLNEKYEYGLLIGKNGESYFGHFKDNKKDGEGTEYENGNIKYDGKFVDGKYEGEGKYIYENGEYYIGNFKNGMKNGFGKEFYKDGKIKYEGYFLNDKYEDNEGEISKENDLFLKGKWNIFKWK